LAARFRSEFGHFDDNPYGATRQQLLDLIQTTPSLQDYASRMWFRHEGALADAVAKDLGLDQPTDEIRAYAGFALQLQLLASELEDPLPLLDAGFRVLDGGWVAHLQAVGDTGSR
jgi:hypothetical protein